MEIPFQLSKAEQDTADWTAIGQEILACVEPHRREAFIEWAAGHETFYRTFPSMALMTWMVLERSCNHCGKRYNV